MFLSFELAPNLTSKENKQKTEGHQIYQAHWNYGAVTKPLKLG
jgi:hypothetical protein